MGALFENIWNAIVNVAIYATMLVPLGWGMELMHTWQIEWAEIALAVPFLYIGAWAIWDTLRELFRW